MSIKKFQQIILVIFLYYCCCQCDNNKDTIKSFNMFPTSLGNKWIYEYSGRIIPYDIEGNLIYDETKTYDAEILVQIDDVSYLINDSTETIRFMAYNSEDPETKFYRFYSNDEGGLLELAYWNVGYYVFVKKKISNKVDAFLSQSHDKQPEASLLFPFNEIRFSDTLFVYNSPRMSLKYPLGVNSEWSYVENDNFKINKVITDISEIKTKAGRFECYKIEHKYFKPELKIEFTDYIAIEGLIKRVISSNKVIITDINGDSLGIGDVITECLLKDYSLEK